MFKALAVEFSTRFHRGLHKPASNPTRGHSKYFCSMILNKIMMTDDWLTVLWPGNLMLRE